jgi:hypothetical protein
MNFKIVAAAVMITTASAHGLAQTEVSNFLKSPTQASDWVVVVNPHGGQYVYTPKAKDLRESRPAFFVGRPDPQKFQLHSAEEEDALWRLRVQNDLVTSLAVNPSMGRVITEFSKQKKRLIWPKVELRGNLTCVPELAFSDQVNWQPHSVCWNPGTSHVE